MKYMKQVNSIQRDELFYVPKSRLKKDLYSQNFVKLFKNALTKVYHCKSKNHQNENEEAFNDSHTINKDASSYRLLQNKKKPNRINTQISPESPFNLLTQRRNLIKQIMQNQNLQGFASNKLQSMSKRCKTYDTSQMYSNSLDQDDELKDIRYKTPSKPRQSSTVNQQRQYKLPAILPSLKSISPKSKAKAKAKIKDNVDLQIIEKYRKMQEQYRSRQYLSIPLQISSISSPISNPIQKSIYNLKNYSQQLSKLINNSKTHPKNKKIRYSLEDFIRYSNRDKKQYQNHQSYSNNIRNDQLNQKLQYLMQQQQILKSLWQQKERKIISNRNSNGENQGKKNKYPFSTNFLQQKKMSTHLSKLNKKEPLDQYFKPWDNLQNQQTCCQNQYIQKNIFNKLSIQENSFISSNGGSCR